MTIIVELQTLKPMEYILQCHLNPYYKSINPWNYKGLITKVPHKYSKTHYTLWVLMTLIVYIPWVLLYL